MFSLESRLHYEKVLGPSKLYNLDDDEDEDANNFATSRAGSLSDYHAISTLDGQQ